MDNHGHNTAGKSPSYETRDVRVRYVWYSAIGIAAVVIFSFYYMRYLFVAYTAEIDSSRPAASPVMEPDPMPPAPRLRVQPAIEMAELRADEDGLLETFAWVDDTHAVARIPVARAMELIATHGIPAMPAPAAPAPAAPQEAP